MREPCAALDKTHCEQQGQRVVLTDCCPLPTVLCWAPWSTSASIPCMATTGHCTSQRMESRLRGAAPAQEEGRGHWTPVGGHEGIGGPGRTSVFTSPLLPALFQSDSFFFRANIGCNSLGIQVTWEILPGFPRQELGSFYCWGP